MATPNVMDVIHQHGPALLKRPGVIGLAEGNARAHGGADAPCVVLFLKEDADAVGLPDQLGGFPVYVVRTPEFLPM